VEISKAGDVIERMKWAALEIYFTSKGEVCDSVLGYFVYRHYGWFVRYMFTNGTGSDWIRERMVERSDLYIGPPSFFYR
jgi:hypothetical protein